LIFVFLRPKKVSVLADNCDELNIFLNWKDFTFRISAFNLLFFKTIFHYFLDIIAIYRYRRHCLTAHGHTNKSAVPFDNITLGFRVHLVFSKLITENPPGDAVPPRGWSYNGIAPEIGRQDPDAGALQGHGGGEVGAVLERPGQGLLRGPFVKMEK